MAPDAHRPVLAKRSDDSVGCFRPMAYDVGSSQGLGCRQMDVATGTRIASHPSISDVTCGSRQGDETTVDVILDDGKVLRSETDTAKSLPTAHTKMRPGSLNARRTRDLGELVISFGAVLLM